MPEFDSTTQIREIADSQIENYLRQPAELVSHFNREISALEGYRGRQLLELLQNADDAGVESGACTLFLHLSRKRLVVANTGSPFSSKGLTALVISDCSPKQLDRNRFIGCKGLGFRSILTWSDCPTISSGANEIAFDRGRAIETVRRLSESNHAVGEIVRPFLAATERWPAAVMRFPFVPETNNPWLLEARTWRDKGYDTALILPLPDDQRGEVIYGEILAQIAVLPTNALLFCRHITQLRVEGGLSKTWELVRANIAPNHTSVIFRQIGADELWHVYRNSGQVSVEAAATASGGRRDFEVAVAVPQMASPNENGTLCVFFPTNERLPCPLVIHATLETTDDRNRIVDRRSNREVLEHLAAHIATVVEGQAESEDPARGLELIAGIENADPELKTMGLVDALVRECKARLIFPRKDGSRGSSTDVRRASHSSWISEFEVKVFPEILAVVPSSPLSGLIDLFRLPWFDDQTVRERLRRFLPTMDRGRAGEVVGRLLSDGQLVTLGAKGLLIDTAGQLIEGNDSFFSPVEKLPTIPKWAPTISFLDEGFQAGLVRGSKVVRLNLLAHQLTVHGAKVDEYRFETVARALIEQADRDLLANDPIRKRRWEELLRWLFVASEEAKEALPRLVIKVVTKGLNLRRATECYLGPDYGGGQIVWRLYQQFSQDEFAASPDECGLGGLPKEKVEAFLIAIGVNAVPRMVPFHRGEYYDRFLKLVVDRIDYPRSIRDKLCHNPGELRNWCTAYGIDGLLLPDRWDSILSGGDTAALIAFLLSSGAGYVAEERDYKATFQATVESERLYRFDPSIPIPNPMLMLLREVPWIPAKGANRKRPSEILLSTQGIRIFQGVFCLHAIEYRDPLVLAYGGRQALESLLIRLGAVSSLETLSGQSLYETLQALPERDRDGSVAPAIYRTLIASSVVVDESPHRNIFIRSGRMWGRYKGQSSYLPIASLRYNANLAVAKAIETHIPLVAISRGMNTGMVKQLFGISSLTSDEIQVSLVSEGTEYDNGSEVANQHLRDAIPYIYALRLARNMDEKGRELALLGNAKLRVCSKAQIFLRLPNDVTDKIALNEIGDGIVIDTTLFVINEYAESLGGFLTFWLRVSELLAELLGRDVADEVGGILRCRTTAEMSEVLRVRFGSEAGARLEDAKARLGSPIEEEQEEEIKRPIPPPKAPDPNPPPPFPVPEVSTGGYSTADNLLPEKEPIFKPVEGPIVRPRRKRRLIVTGLGGGGGGVNHGPIATESVTFKVVEAYEMAGGRFVVPVSHLHGSESFGCDMLSVVSEAVRVQALAEQSISEADILRYIEVKGRSSRTGEVELTDNEYQTAQREGGRYWLYRVFVDPNREFHFELALLNDPINSRAARTVTRFDLSEGSGANWLSMVEKDDESDEDSPS